MVGMSLSYKNLVYTDDELLAPKLLLPKLWDQGVRSVELRSVMPDADAVEVKNVADMLWDHGFNVTVHSYCHTLESAVSDVFAPLSEVLTDLRQSELMLTLHPIGGDNVVMLTKLSDHILKHNYPVRIALENNRKMPDGVIDNCVDFVLDIVNSVGRENVGICFDMGHFAWYASNYLDSPSVLPPSDFISKVIHTHIHAYAEGTTHFPLDEWREPFSLYINALRENYRGIYNIELEPNRFFHRWSSLEAYLMSADILKCNLS